MLFYCTCVICEKHIILSLTMLCEHMPSIAFTRNRLHTPTFVMQPAYKFIVNDLDQCFSTSVRPRPGKFFFIRRGPRPNKFTRKYLSNFF